ncbi:MAG: pitrilysin family protein [Patescibacteria group bacterium]
MKFTEKKFKNGLRAIVAPMESTQTITILVLVGTGSNYEARDISGLSHFLEHMFFKGTTKYPKPGELDRLLDSVGAIHNAFTTREETGYWIKVDTKQFDLALLFVSDILQNALLKEEEINRERGVILEEMKMYWDDPRRHVWSLFEELVYGDNAYGWDVIGTAENIRTIKRSDFLKYWKSQYVAHNTVVTVAGNISEGETLRKIEKAFGKLRVGTPVKAAAYKDPKSGPRMRLFEKNTDQSHIVVGTLGYPLESKDRVVADVLSTILGGYMSSRLWADIRGRHGLAYAIRAGHDAYLKTGYFGAYAGVPHERSIEVVERIVGHLGKIKQGGVTAEELKRAKDNIKGHLAISLESTDEVASFLGTQEIMLGKIKKPDELIKKVDAVTRQDIARVAKSLFRKDKLYLSIIGPKLEKGPYEQILKKAL